MKIEIRPKKGVEQLFERESCDILHATGWAECGIARKPGTWEYSIQLFVGDRKDALLDPDVIIHPDP
jgi:hypothetical protein